MDRGRALAETSQAWAGLVECPGRECPIRHRMCAVPHMFDSGPFVFVHRWRVEWYET